ncbi:phage baseplate protein [Mycoavidus sp. SF9855]|uniref:phage baseplate protein n=1 Tax=Mycoavidus sp. SF9855 TaxID=2968475 RepID=UPI00211BC92E|nr:hypothetical protein [Mycoavidus sp. SF9855]UUM20926.1 hypothetical protein NQD60_05440 [Mycoavidus sp. SF9855]
MIAGFFPTAAIDVVGLFDDSFAQCFVDARPIKSTVKEASKTMEHPIESGATITDHRILLPVEIELSMMLPSTAYRNTYAQIREAYLNGQVFSVQTKAGRYPNMLITNMPHEEDPDIFDSIMLSLRLKEVLLVKAQYEDLPPQKVRNKSHASTVQRGEQSGKPTKKQSTLHELLF